MARLFHFFLFSLFAVSVCAQVQIKLKSTSAERLEAITLNGIAVGVIEKDETKTVTLDSLTLDDGLPVLTISTLLNGKKLESHHYIQCGAPLPKFTTVTEGTYNRNIVVGINKYNQEPYIGLSIDSDKEKWDKKP